jgi:hypothetical protein
MIMRVSRFEAFLRDLLQPTGVITSVSTFAGDGYKEKPFGLVVGFANSSRVYLQFVGATPPGGENYGEPEKIVEKTAPTPVDVPALTLEGGRVSLRDFEQYLRAVILGSGSREVASVRAFSAGEGSGVHRYGLGVTFHNGGSVFVLVVHTVPAGREIRPDAEFKPMEYV